METARVNRYLAATVYLFSFSALLPLLVLYGRALGTGHLPAPEPDEGTGAHVFQLSLVLLMPAGLAYLATADWTRPARTLGRLGLPALFVIAAFALLYAYEHRAF